MKIKHTEYKQVISTKSLTITLETDEDIEAFEGLLELPIRPGRAREMWFQINNYLSNGFITREQYEILQKNRARELNEKT